ncbi:MAG: hypothetical protein L6Q78_13320 [Bacteroidia bacterium]|nr:hypothetical protein [Bacteroidia bacterium]
MERINSRKYQLIAQLLWDTTLQVNDVLPVLEGKKEAVGHVDKKFLFKRSLESYSWFTLLELFSIQEIRQLLNKSLIGQIRSRSLQKKYIFMYEFLQRPV